MFWNRVVYLVFLIATGIFASFYGGNIPYMLFYFALLLPVFCFVYTLYVDARFKIHQRIPVVKIIKKESVPYTFILANEDYFTFSSIKVTFHEDKSHIRQDDEMADHCLPPVSNKKMSGTIYGDYRGTYEVGAKSVEIMDFLCLFKINYPVKSKIKMIVSPRIITGDRLKLASFIQDSENTRNKINPIHETVENDLRKYVKGDNRKLIHWKASAKQRELLTKKYADIEEMETLFLMDLTKIDADYDEILIVEDKIIELSLMIIQGFYQAKIPVRTIFESTHLYNEPIRTAKEFELFYNKCTELEFHSKRLVNLLVNDCIHRYSENNYYIIVTAILDRELFETVLSMAKNGKQITFFYIRRLEDEMRGRMLKAMRDIGICVYDIWMDADLLELFHIS